jgi:hypothetical protein
MTWIFLRWTQIKLYLHHQEWAINPLLSEISNQQEFINGLLDFSLPNLLFYSVDWKPMIASMGEKANICNCMGTFVNYEWPFDESWPCLWYEWPFSEAWPCLWYEWPFNESWPCLWYEWPFNESWPCQFMTLVKGKLRKKNIFLCVFPDV